MLMGGEEQGLQVREPLCEVGPLYFVCKMASLVCETCGDFTNP